MKVYFVRHGSTDSLEKKISQPNDEPLNNNGISQARELEKRFSNTQIDIVISSPHLRAVQTAKAISENVQTSELFAEVRKPSEVIGKPKETEEVRAILDKISEMNLIDPSWHYSDEENFEDLKKRGLKALEFLENLGVENVVMVSHGHFVAQLIGLMIFKEDFSINISLKLKNFMRFSNTGVSILNFEDNKWKMLCWNDTSHCLE